MMKRLARFLARNKYKGIPNLMMYILFGTALVFIIGIVPEMGGIAGYFMFDRAAVLGGQVWRVLTFMFTPPFYGGDLFGVLFFVFFISIYLMIGRTLEREWGTLKFNLYYLTGMLSLLTVGFIFDVTIDATYLTLSLFLAFATLFPDVEFRIFFILPLKVKWLALLDAAFQVAMVVMSPGWYRLVPLMSLLNYLLYFWPHWVDFIRRRPLGKPSRVIKFRDSVQSKRERQGYIHKCAVCGKTDADAPDEEFRYCSVCTNYKCYCAEHLFTHEHQ